MSRSYHNPTTVPTPRSDGHSADARRAVPVANPATAGVLAGAVGLGTAELLAALIGPISSPLLAIADRVVDLSPTGVREWAISTLGTLDKPATIVGTLLILAAISAGLGRLAACGRRQAAWASAGAAAVALVGASAAWSGRTGGPGAGLGAIVGGAVSAVALWMLFGAGTAAATDDDMPADERATGADTPPPTSIVGRRTLVRGLGMVAIAQLALAGAIRFVGGKSQAAAARRRVTLPAVDEQLEALPNAGSGGGATPGLSPLITPNDGFYRIDTAFTVPSIDPATWQLTIGGGSRGPLTLSYADLLAREQIEIDCTLSCVSNEVGGSLVGNARWQGVELAPLLAEAGIPDGTTQVGATSTDGWSCGFPIETLDRPPGDPTPPAIIAVGMNGEPLPLIHGFPARLVIPGLYGYVSACKWLETIELTTWEDFTGYWVPRGWSKEAPIKTQSRIDVPAEGSTVNAGAATIAGVAWAGIRALSKVEVRVDGGPWRAATLGPELSEATWRQWWLDWDATPGRHTLTVRATDGDGVTQTAQPSRPDPDGATGWHAVVVTVR